MEIRIRETGQVVTEADFRSLHRNTSFPMQLNEQLLNEFGADSVLNSPEPQATRYQSVIRDGVQEINGKWFTKFSVMDMDAQAIAEVDANQAEAVRNERNRRLSETDWRFRSDMSPSQAWIDYCQALRDIPLQQGFPWEVNWAVEP